MTAATDTALQVSPLSGWTGALITGVDLSAPLADEELAAIRAALHEWKVVFFRDSHSTTLRRSPSVRSSAT